MENLSKLEHPKGLYLLFLVEMWERFSFYGMRALIVLYMVQHLMFSTEKAGNIYGLYTGLIYLTPLLGGYLADRFFGQRKCITTGAILMSIGLFMLASGNNNLFFIALFFMIAANGFFKSNISSVLGLLYGDDDSKKDSGYTIFYMGINTGAFLSPLVCGTIAVKYGYHYGFATAGVGMLIGLLCYKIFENKLLGKCGLYPIKTLNNNCSDSEELNEKQRKQLFALLGLLIFTIVFWTCFEQAGSSLTLFAEYSTNRVIGSYTIPTGYFQSLNPFYIITLAPLITLLWSYLKTKKKEPTSVEKFTIALGLISAAYLVMAYAGYLSEISLVSPLWLVLVYLIMTLAELCLSPIGLSLVSKLAPKKFLSLMMGVWFLTSFIGNTLAGFWGGKYGTISNVALFLTLAGVSFIACLILSCLTKKFNKFI